MMSFKTWKMRTHGLFSRSRRSQLNTPRPMNLLTSATPDSAPSDVFEHDHQLSLEEHQLSSIEEHIMFPDETLLDILGYLELKDLLRARVCRRWREAVKHIPVASLDWAAEDFDDSTELYVASDKDIKAISWLPDAVPKLESVQFNLFNRHRIRVLKPAEMNPITRFHHLTNLSLHDFHLKGDCTYIFDSFPNLKSLCLYNVGKLKWDLSMLQNMPRLERLIYDDNDGHDNDKITGDLSSMHVLKDSLIELSLFRCSEVKGNVMDLACFSSLESVYLDGCNKILGDIRDIGHEDFPSLESLVLPDSVWGGGDLPSVEETPTVMSTWHSLQKERPRFFARCRFCLPLRYHERYGIDDDRAQEIPTIAEFVMAFRRKGWRWTNGRHGGACETNWFDPEPEMLHEECYGVYLEDLKRLEAGVARFKGLFEPPTVEEYLQRNDMYMEIDAQQRQGTDDDTWWSK